MFQFCVEIMSLEAVWYLYWLEQFNWFYPWNMVYAMPPMLLGFRNCPYLSAYSRRPVFHLMRVWLNVFSTKSHFLQHIQYSLLLFWTPVLKFQLVSGRTFFCLVTRWILKVYVTALDHICLIATLILTHLPVILGDIPLSIWWVMPLRAESFGTIR